MPYIEGSAVFPELLGGFIYASIDLQKPSQKNLAATMSIAVPAFLVLSKHIRIVATC
jgi:hypothetical protein